jgi:hypothetical protein
MTRRRRPAPLAQIAVRHSVRAYTMIVGVDQTVATMCRRKYSGVVRGGQVFSLTCFVPGVDMDVLL